jgi:methyltransferase-like protein
MSQTVQPIQSNKPGTSYDDVPYVSRAFIQTHPQRLAFIGRLFGMNPTPPSIARVLELGCASGGNLIPLAQRYPGMEILGLDLSKVQVEQGMAEIKALGLKNIELRQADLGAYKPAKDGKFDYVLCHGVYSWVPESVRDAIMRICREALTENGIAYISYNCYPGWKMREIIRDAMNFHAGTRPTPAERVQQSRAIINFITEISEKDSAFGKILQAEADLLKVVSDDYLLHEHLEEHNEPCYFKDFVAKAGASKLAYLGEAQLEEMIPHHLGPKVMDALNRVSGGNILAIEQYLDFFRNRRFRRTLLVREELAAGLKRDISAEGLAKFHVAGAFKIEGYAPLHTTVEQKFSDSEGRNLASTQPMAKAMMHALNDAWPETLTIPQWKEKATAKLKDHPEHLQGADKLFEEVLVRGFANGLFHVVDEPVTSGSADIEKPVASSFARLRASNNSREVSNSWHQTINLNDLQLALVQLMDGTRDREAILQAIIDKCVAGDLKLANNNVPITDKPTIEHLVRQLIPQAIKDLRRLGLLVQA